MKGTNQIETTDNVIIKEEIPSNCPFVLARDAREEGGRWRILLRKALGERQNLFVEMEKVRIEFEQDKSVKVNGKKVDIKPGTEKDVTGGKITSFDNKLYLKADVSSVLLLFHCKMMGYLTIFRDPENISVNICLRKSKAVECKNVFQYSGAPSSHALS